MDKIRSLYLECLRVLAAFYVFIYHVGAGGFGQTLYFSTKNFNKKLCLTNLAAHYFVIIFFVLSGFLITMSVFKPAMTFKSFLIARLGRLYSVLIPALIFSYLVTFILIHGNYVPRSLIQNTNNLWIRFFLNIAFLTQTWSLCSTPPLNNPFWSVNYEFIYYLIIAVFFLIKSPRIKFSLLAIILLLACPKVLLLFPSWLSGALLFFFRDKTLTNKKMALALFILSVFCLGAIMLNPHRIPFSKNENENDLYGLNLLFSWNYQADFIFSLIISANIYFLFSISNAIFVKTSGNILNKVHAFIMKIGSCSYTLYLFHLPLLFLFTVILPYNKTNHFHLAGLIILVLSSVAIIARYTEWKVKWWRIIIEKLFNYLSLFVNKRNQPKNI